MHVAGPALVHVLGPLDSRARVREVFVTADASDALAGFVDKFVSVEEFIIGLQVRFADHGHRADLLRLLSTVKHETVKTSLDDGVTQVVQARAGVALVADVPVPNPVILAGYRTFRELPQPPSLYALRVQSGRSGGLPEVGLFQADGGAWRLGAIEAIRAWLVSAVPADVTVLA